MSVAELLKNLIDLQILDKDIYDMKKWISEMPARLNALDDEMEAASSKSKEKDDELKRLQLKRKERELDLEQKENNIKKLQSQLYQVKTNKEYNALEHEISGFEADKSVLEEDILSIFDLIETAEKALEEAKKELEDEEKKIEIEKKKIEDEKKETDKSLSELDGKRKNITPLIDKKMLSRYEWILSGKEGVALVPVVGENCGGCFMNLPPQIIDEIRLKKRVMACERCARILYAEEEK